MKMSIRSTIAALLLLFAGAANAFVTPTPNPATKLTTSLNAQPSSVQELKSKLLGAAAVVSASIPAAVWAVVDEDYEYGKVDAPIGIAVAGGILAILTAAIPVLLRPGEEALEEMRENEGYTFGKDNKDALNKRR